MSVLRDQVEDGPSFERLHAELRRAAGAIFADQRDGHTLQPTAIINEAWLKLREHDGVVGDRVHFLALAARAMRQVLADHARTKSRAKRGGHARDSDIDPEHLGAREAGFDPIDLHEALDRLAQLSERQARVAELRLLGCLTCPEIAGLLGIGEATVKRDWAFARLWLADRLGTHD